MITTVWQRLIERLYNVGIFDFFSLFYLLFSVTVWLSICIMLEFLIYFSCRFLSWILVTNLLKTSLNQLMEINNIPIGLRRFLCLFFLIPNHRNVNLIDHIIVINQINLTYHLLLDWQSRHFSSRHVDIIKILLHTIFFLLEVLMLLIFDIQKIILFFSFSLLWFYYIRKLSWL